MAEPEQPTTPPPATPLRRVAGLLIRGPIGCISFLLGAGVVLVAVVPTIVEHSGADAIEDSFEQEFDGGLEIGDLDLAWFGRQSIGAIALEDPDGDRVARASLSFPSLFELATAKEGFGRIRLAASTVDLEREGDGRWNLARALARSASRVAPTAGSGEAAASGPLSVLRGERVLLELLVERLRVVDGMDGGPDEPLTIEGLDIRLEVTPGRAGTLVGSGRITAPEPSTIELDGLLATGDGLAGPLPITELRVRIERFSVGWLDSFLRQDGRLEDLVGSVATIELEARRDDDESLLARLDVTGARAVSTLHFVVHDGRIAVDSERTSQVRLLEPKALADGYLADLLPPHLTLGTSAETIAIDLRQFEWPLPVALGGTGDGAIRPRIEASAALGSWRLGTPGGPLDLVDVEVATDLSPGAGLRAGLVARTGAEGGLTIDVATAPLDELLEGAEVDRVPAVDIVVGLADVATAPVDAALGADGLLDALLGGRLSATATLRPTEREGVFSASIRATSPVCDLDLDGEVEGGRLIGQEGRPLTTSFDLTPLSSPRIVGSILPLLAAAEKPPGADRASIRLEDFELPLDGDLTALRGVLRLDLGVVRARWLPELAAGLGQDLLTIELDPVVVRLLDGSVVHDPFELEIQGRKVALSGGVDLRTGEARFDALVPTAVIGGDLGKLVGKLGLGATDEVELPVTIRGKWPRLSFEFDSATMESSVRAELEQRLGGAVGERMGTAVGELLEEAVGAEAAAGLRSLIRSLGGGN